MAVAGLVLGIIATVVGLIPFGIFCIWPVSILAIVFGAIGHNRANSGQSDRKNYAMAGWILGIVSMVVAPFLWIFVFAGIGAAVDECPETPALTKPCDVY